MGWYDGAINAIKQAEKEEKVFIWLDEDKMYEHETALRKRLDEFEDDLSDMLFREFESDPDKFNFDGEIVLYYTLEGCEDHKQYIVIAGNEQFERSIKDQIEEGLKLYYGETMKDEFVAMEKQSWREFERTAGKFLVAYRGGYGYNYSLYERVNFKADMQEA
jgi:hypothetical protein